MIFLTNEIIFFIHIVALVASTIAAFRLGKSALVALLCSAAILENLFVAKQISLFTLCVTCTDAFAVGTGLCLNLIQEYYGRAAARNALWVSFGILGFYLVMSQIHLFYIPDIQDVTQESYSLLLGIMPRIITASLISYLLTQQIDYRLYHWLKQQSVQSQILRNYGSLLVSQLIDTVCFSVLGLWGIVTSLTDIIVLSYTIKIVTILITTPLIIGGIKALSIKKGEA